MATIHTFETITPLTNIEFKYLLENLPCLTVKSSSEATTNYYSQKGITGIKLWTRVVDGVTAQHFLILRYNLAKIMRENSLFLFSLSLYKVEEIVSQIFTRFYEINEFRYIKLHDKPIEAFKPIRVDIAEDILCFDPTLYVWLANMSVENNSCGYGMERTSIDKPMEQVLVESCCFENQSRRLNIYSKYTEVVNNSRELPEDVYCRMRLHLTLRFEVQLRKPALQHLNKKGKFTTIPSLMQVKTCNEYLLNVCKDFFRAENYVSQSKAIEIINSSSYSDDEKSIMLGIIKSIPEICGLWNFEKDEFLESFSEEYSINLDLKSFRKEWLSKFYNLGIQPVTFPDGYPHKEVPSIISLLGEGDYI